MPWLWLSGLVKVWVAWKVSQKAALLAAILTLGTYLSNLLDNAGAIIQGLMSGVSAELYGIFCILGVWEGVDIILLAGSFAFWWFAWRAFFNLRA